MLQVTNIQKSYGKQLLFDGVSFTVNPRERVGLVGRNGHGKTTLFRMILRDEHPDSGAITMPSGYTVGHLSQHIHFSKDTVLKEACLTLPVNEDHRDETYKAEAILHGLGFTNEDFDRPPSSLSGGYQVRLNLAKVLVSGPHLLLLDEPTNYLDIVSVRWLTQFLRAWRNELIIITHDRDFMDDVTTHTMIIHRCKMRKIAGGTQKLYDQILMEEEIYEKTRQNDEKKRKEIEQFINRFRAQATKARAVQSRIKALAKHENLEKLDEIKTLDFKFRSAPFEAKWLMTVENLSFAFKNGPKLIEGLSFGVGKKDRIAVIGKNGKGKTTLLNLLANEMAPTGGEVRLHPNTKIAYFGQTNINRLRPEQTALQEVMDAHPDYAQGESRAICGLMMFEGDNALKKVSVLSGGERSRVLLGKLLVSPANLLLLDEPTNHLDMESIDSLIEAIDAFDGAVMIVTHSERILEAVATKLIVFDNDTVSVFEGTYLDFLERIGWSDEGGAKPKKGKKQQEAEKPAVNRKDAKKLRTRIISGKSKALGALKNRIASLELEITKLEQEMDRDNEALLEASMKGKALDIRRLSGAVRDAKARIDALFIELEIATNEHDAKANEFDQQLNELAEIS